jgi:putative MATE family efflux protein
MLCRVGVEVGIVIDAAPSGGLDPRTRRLLEAPLVPTLLRLGAPNVLIMLAQAAVGLIETFFVGKLGTDALAGMALVFPAVMLMQTVSAGAFGGAIASVIARALGASQRAEADALVLHALAIAAMLGTAFMVAAIAGGHALFSWMGGTHGALAAALTYSNWVFAGAVLVWIFNSLSAVIRGTGNMTVPALVSCTGSVALIPLSPLLIFGWGPIPALGIAGGAVALLAYYFFGSVALATYLWSSRSLLRPSLSQLRFRWARFRDILRLGTVGAISAAATNVTIAIATAQVARFGTAAIAGYGTAARLEYLLIPLVFGLGSPLVAIVGTSVGAGLRERALKAAWVGTALAFGMTELIGAAAALWPDAWMSLFASDAAMRAAGAQYLHAVGTVYGFFGVGLVLYFASQGAGKLAWPVLGNLARLTVAALGGVAALRWGHSLMPIFAAQAAALVIYAFINAAAVAGGSWFGPIDWRRSTRSLRSGRSSDDVTDGSVYL